MAQRSKFHFQILGHNFSFFPLFFFNHLRYIYTCMFPTVCNKFWFCFNSRMKPLVQLVHSLKTRMESPDYEMVGDKVKERKADRCQKHSFGREGEPYLLSDLLLDSGLREILVIFLGFCFLLLRPAFLFKAAKILVCLSVYI